MKFSHKSIRLSVSLAALFFAQSGFADGTEAGTIVSNTAVLSYSVGGAVQSDITSDVADFKVDQKVDLSVTGDSTANIIVGPSSARATAANKLTYVLSNDGNFEQIFKLTVSHLTSPTDDFDAGTTTTTTPQAAESCQYSIYDDATTPVLISGPHELTVNQTVTLGIDEKATIEVNCSMPNRPDVDDGDLSIIDVMATAVDGTGATMAESTIADREDEVDVVLADAMGTATDGAIRNAMHSATQTYEIDAPMLSVVKTSAVIEDPYNVTTNPKRIPGAIVEYTITISNTSDSEATGVKITDILTAAVDGEVEFIDGTITSTSGTSSFATGTKTLTAEGLTVPAATGGTAGEAKVTFKVKIL